MTSLEALQEALGPRYEITRELGRGGWATVYLAVDRKHERPVAIKLFHPQLASSLGTGRFLQEIRLVAQFQHPHIIPLHDSGETADSLFFVMPYVAGESLRQRLERDGRLSVAETLAVVRDVAGALDYAHARGVVHRDIKPENVLLAGPHAFVADFGIALAVRAATGEVSIEDGAPSASGPFRASGGGRRMSRPGLAVGTPAYMSPEQALGTADPDPRSDVYSLGIVAYEMLAGRAPFPDLTLQGVVDRHLDGTAAPPPLDSVRDDVPPATRAAITRALALEPTDRFDSAGEFLAAMTPEGAADRVTLDDWSAVTHVATRTRRRATAVTAALALLALLGLGWELWRHRQPGGVAGALPVSPNAVAVFPFTVRGSADVAYLGKGMVDLLSTDLDGAGELRGVDAHAVLGSLAADGDGAPTVTPARAEALARRLGAGLYVLGSVLESSGRLRIHAALYGRDRAGAPIATATVEGENAKLFDLVDELSTQLIATRRHGPAARLTRLAAVTTRSLPALKAYLEGESQLRAGRYDSAMFAYGRAVAADSQFALAYYQRAVAADWDAKFDDARASADQAIRYSSRLADDDRALLVAFLAWQRGDADEAERLYRAILHEHPDNVEAWYNLGEVLFHYSAVRGRTMSDARPAFERAVFLDPQNTDARLHLLDIAAKDGRRADFDSLLAGADPKNPYIIRRRALRAFAGGTRAEQDSVLAEMRTTSDGSLIVAAWGVANYLQDLPDAARISTMLLDSARDREVRAFGHALLAQIELGRGRWRATTMEIDSTAALDRVLGLEYRGFLTSLPFTPATARELRDARATVAAWKTAPTDRSTSTSNVLRTHNGVHPLVRLYLLGTLSSRLGDVAEAERAEAELRRVAQGEAGPAGGAAPTPAMDTLRRALAADLAHAVRAQRAWHDGRAAEALAALERINGEAPIELSANSPFYSHVAERFLRAEALHALGRDEEAARYYGGLSEGRFDIAFLAPAQMRLAEIAERAGDRRAAALHYARAAQLWQDCDPELRPVAERARRKAEEGQ